MSDEDLLSLGKSLLNELEPPRQAFFGLMQLAGNLPGQGSAQPFQH
ncbi:hypothetical protein [Methylobacterium oryzisoli]